MDGVRWLRRVTAACVGMAALAMAPVASAKADLFDGGPPLEITLTAPFPALVKSALTSTSPHSATLTVSEPGGPAQTLPIQLSPRGMTRRTGGYCKFPPLLLKFDKASAHGTVFHGQHKLKLVTYCRPGADYEQRIVLEYLAYRLFNVITPMSYRVRAVEVTYRNADGKGEALRRFGFVIEDIDDMAGRNDRDRLEAASKQVKPVRMDGKAAARAALFEYMIGNLDWDFLAGAPGAPCCHNSRLIAARDAKPESAEAVVPVPYDFDYSGLINAPYAEVPEGLPVQKVTDRLYRGYCVSKADLPAVVEEYRAHRAELAAVIAGEPHLNPEFRDRASAYLDGFFKILDDPGRVQKDIVGHCR